jgi:hypothetical protein
MRIVNGEMRTGGLSLSRICIILIKIKIIARAEPVDLKALSTLRAERALLFSCGSE